MNKLEWSKTIFVIWKANGATKRRKLEKKRVELQNQLKERLGLLLDSG